MKYTAEEVRALFEAWAEENGYDVLRIEPDYNDGFTAAAWHGYQAAYAERIEAAQVDTAAKPRTLADFVNAPDAERVQIGQQVAARVDEMMAEPVAQTAQMDESRYTAIGRAFREVLADPSVAWRDTGAKTFIDRVRQTTSRIESTLTAEPAPPINLVAVREVIASHINEAKNLRHDPESQDYLYEQADKLEAAIKGVA